MEIIKVENLRKEFVTKKRYEGFRGGLRSVFNPEYDRTTAVNNVSFSVDKGEMLGFIGPNGAGKSTTIKLITGILYPDQGSISVLGMDPHKERKRLAYEIGTVFGQKSQLWFHLPPMDSFKLLGAIYDLKANEVDKRIKYLTEIFEIGDFINRPVRKLSLGQRIRCEIAASLIHSPSILFLDEPSIGLDVVVKKRLRDLILRVNSEDKTTIFLTSHDAGDIEKLCKRCIVVNSGEIVWDDSVKEMKYSLLNKRVIDLKLDRKLFIKRPGVELLKSTDYSAKLEVDLHRASVEEVLGDVMADYKIQDMTIKNPPLEEVITHIYKEVKV